ncbi:MAG: 3-methyl-2-oxobutanoate hydroxymethyltransferase [Candidatus Eisenbacteria bacterium]|nr:3-methyl-2-oxobutanoate hydroxymethyltransferase [Candidatus Eisenbacteria bacterium]
MTRETRITVPELKSWKARGRKIPVLTCYDFSMARILDRCGVPVLLVGDSLGQVVLGYDSTLQVTLEDMIHHTRAVARARPAGLVIADMPFLSFQVSPERALDAAGRLIREGQADGVKIEGGERSLEAARRLNEAGIPVMGHLGLTPQSVLTLGGYRVRGRDPEERAALLRDAVALEKAGCFSIVLESIPAPLAAEITAAVSIPTIGIGAGSACDGQVLVLYDMLGIFTEFRARFVRRFLEGAEQIEAAVREYMGAVERGEFPAREHSYGNGDDREPARENREHPAKERGGGGR